MIKFQLWMAHQRSQVPTAMRFGWWFLKSAGPSFTAVIRELMEDRPLKHWEIWQEHQDSNTSLRMKRTCGQRSSSLIRKSTWCVLVHQEITRMQKRHLESLLDTLMDLSMLQQWKTNLARALISFNSETHGARSNGKDRGQTLLMTGLTK